MNVDQHHLVHVRVLHQIAADEICGLLFSVFGALTIWEWYE